MARALGPFRAAVYALVARIPPGRVMTYGQVALALGLPRAARQVGGALHLLPADTPVPWHRVVNHRGGISPRWNEAGRWEQAARLRAEGVAVDDGLHLDLARYRWWPDRAALADLALAPEVLHAVDALAAADRAAASRPILRGSRGTRRGPSGGGDAGPDSLHRPSTGARPRRPARPRGR